MEVGISCGAKVAKRITGVKLAIEAIDRGGGFALSGAVRVNEAEDFLRAYLVAFLTAADGLAFLLIDSRADLVTRGSIHSFPVGDRVTIILQVRSLPTL